MNTLIIGEDCLLGFVRKARLFVISAQRNLPSLLRTGYDEYKSLTGESMP
jgi:hypothetical protein